MIRSASSSIFSRLLTHKVRGNGLSYQAPAVGVVTVVPTPVGEFVYFRPDGSSLYFRPASTDLYIRQNA